MKVEFTDDEVYYVPVKILKEVLKEMKDVSHKLAKYVPEKKERF